MSPPSENSEYEVDVEPHAKDNRTTNRLGSTGEVALKQEEKGSSKTEYYTESEPSPKKPESNTKPGIDPVVWK